MEHSTKMVHTLLSNMQDPISFDTTPVGDEAEEGTLANLIEDESLPSSNDLLNSIILQDGIQGDLMAVLTPREREVITLRFGLGAAKEHTLEDTGGKLKVTRERARQIEWKALTKIRNSWRWRKMAEIV
jgi:RNA polymerase primary sigma factor